MNRVARAALLGLSGLAAIVPGFAATQTIAFDAIPNQILGISPFPIAAEASSGLPVTFVSTTPMVCKNADDLVMLLSAGTCSITASQSGNGAYAAAIPVSQSFTVTQANTSGSFMAPVGSPFGVEALPFSVVVGHFSGNSNPADLATANGNGTVTVFIGNGSGGFSVSPVSLGAAPNFIAASLAVGDFNGDGIQDLAVAGYYSDETPQAGTVTILIGNGSGGFTAGNPITVGTMAYSLAVGDFNGDGIQDLAVANEGDGTITVLLGNGSGGFTAVGSPVPVGTSPRLVAVGDFNRDGMQDLVVANFASSTITVLLGNGSGGFTEATGSPFSTGPQPVSVVVGDFNGDGIQDIATANLSYGNVAVLLGNGSGGFTPTTDSPFSVGSAPYSVVVGDFNGDGKQDLAVANSATNNVTVLLGNGLGAFTAMADSPLAAGNVPAYVAVGDFNGDGIEDLAVANVSSGNLSVLLGAVVGDTPQTITFGTPGNVTYGVSPYTLNGTSSSGLGVSFASTTSNVCTTSGNTVTILSGSICSIVASQAGNATYAAAATVMQSFAVNAATQTITFPAPYDMIIGAAPFALIATAGSGLPVSFASTTSAVCTVSGTTVTLVTTGTCTIQATQPGDSSYLLAPPVNRSFTVTQYSPCDLKQTGIITVADVQLMINEALGVSSAVNDLNGDGMVNVIDVQIEINAALGLGCAATDGGG